MKTPFVVVVLIKTSFATQEGYDIATHYSICLMMEMNVKMLFCLFQKVAVICFEAYPSFI